MLYPVCQQAVAGAAANPFPAIPVMMCQGPALSVLQWLHRRVIALACPAATTAQAADYRCHTTLDGWNLLHIIQRIIK